MKVINIYNSQSTIENQFHVFKDIERIIDEEVRGNLESLLTERVNRVVEIDGKELYKIKYSNFYVDVNENAENGEPIDFRVYYPIDWLHTNIRLDIIAFLVKSAPLECPHGDYNGYLGIHKSLHLNETYQSSVNDEDKDYDYLDYHVSAHCGITLDEKAGKERFSQYQVLPLIGDCSDLEDYRIIGFDTAHLNDTSEMWNLQSVAKETIDFYEQMINYINNLNPEEQ